MKKAALSQLMTPGRVDQIVERRWIERDLWRCLKCGIETGRRSADRLRLCPAGEPSHTTWCAVVIACLASLPRQSSPLLGRVIAPTRPPAIIESERLLLATYAASAPRWAPLLVGPDSWLTQTSCWLLLILCCLSTTSTRPLAILTSDNEYRYYCICRSVFIASDQL